LTTREAAWYRYNFSGVCMYVCNAITFESLHVGRKFIFTHPIIYRGLRVKFVYEGHRVKVKVTGAKRSKISVRAK